MVFRFLTRTELATTSSFLKTDFLYNHLLQLLIVLTIQKCRIRLSKLTIGGQSSSSESRGCILDIIFKTILIKGKANNKNISHQKNIRAMRAEWQYLSIGLK